MSSLHFKNDNHSAKGNNKGFYIALGVCLIAIGVAAWATYDSVVKYANPETTVSSSPAKETQRTQSGVYAAESKPVSSAPESEKPAVSSRAPETSSKAPAASSPAKAKQTATQPESFVYPAGKTVAKNFSGDNLIYSDTMGDWRAHKGTDFSANIGDPVKAMAAGKVTDSYKDQDLGNVLVIGHGTVTAYYCGLGDTLLVKKGDTVKSGQKIGSVGTVPVECAEKPHLHLEVKKSGKLIDPLTLFQ